MLERGQITPAQHHAGRQIHRVWMAITSSLQARTTRFDGGGGVSLATDWPAELAVLHSEIYLPWIRSADHILWPIGEPRTPECRYCDAPIAPSRTCCEAHRARSMKRNRTLTKLVMTVVVDGYGIDQAAQRFEVHHETALRWFRYGLDLFLGALDVTAVSDVGITIVTHAPAR
jgi:hypothetical protein